MRALEYDMPESTAGIDTRQSGTVAWKCMMVSIILDDPLIPDWPYFNKYEELMDPRNDPK
jgi:hypothetical protein